MSSDLSTPRALRWSAAGFALAVFGVSGWHWWSFQYRTFDLAFYVQGLWLALRGEGHVSLLGVSVLGNHVEPLVFLLTPLFAICPHPLLLVAVQTAALATMPFTGWRIARRLGLESRAAFWLALTTILMPATGFVGIHEFHPEAFAAPLLLLLIEARLAARLGWFWLCFAAVLACKENMALLLIAWGGVQAIWDWHRPGREQWRWNLLPLLAAAVWFVICTRVITPALNAGKVDYVALYAHLGATGGEIIAGFFREPQVAFAALWRGISQGNLVWGLLVPLLALPLLRPRWLLIGLPILLQHLLSWRASEWSLNFHYAAPLIPLVWMAAAGVVARSSRALPLAGALAIACALSQLAFGPVRIVLADLPTVPLMWSERVWKARLLAKIPPEASVSASMPYLAHLAARRELYSLHHVLKGLNTLSRGRYAPPPPPEVVLIDYTDTATFDPAAGFYHPAMRTVTGEVVPSSDRLLHDFLRQAKWSASAVNSVTLLRRDGRTGMPFEQSQPTRFDETTTLLAAAWTQAPGPIVLRRAGTSASETARLRLGWEFTGERAVFPWLVLLLKGEGGEYLLTRGLCAIETGADATLEDWQVFAPATVPARSYRVRAFFTNRAAPQATAQILHALDLGDVQVAD